MPALMARSGLLHQVPSPRIRWPSYGERRDLGGDRFEVFAADRGWADGGRVCTRRVLRSRVASAAARGSSAARPARVLRRHAAGAAPARAASSVRRYVDTAPRSHARVAGSDRARCGIHHRQEAARAREAQSGSSPTLRRPAARISDSADFVTARSVAACRLSRLRNPAMNTSKCVAL